MELILFKTDHGFMPATEAELDKARRFKIGATIRAEVSEMRNYRFFKKWWALVTIGFDYWAETAKTQEYKGQPVLPDLERFRKDITIMAGFYRPVWNIKGELRLEAESLKFGSMTEERFEKLFSATINALLQKALPKDRYSEKQLRELVEQIVGFA